MRTLLLLALMTIPAYAQTPTLVQQLQSYLAYQQAELDEYGPPPTCGSNCYHYYAVQRLTKQLAAATAAAAAGSPLPPILTENGAVASVYSGGPTSRGTK